MFLGRERELQELKTMYESPCFELMILYGRRRVGKTALLTQFAKKRNAIYFSAEQTSDKENLSTFSALVAAHYGEKHIAAFSSWEQVFSYISERQKDQRLLLVIDEFPYLAERNKPLLSKLQHIIDHQLKDSRLFLILCGSYVSFMERKVLSRKSPLFGRRTGQMKLKPFDYLDSASFLKTLPNDQKLLFYGALGGTPLYLGRVDTSMDFAENVKRLFLTPNGYFYDEPLFLLREEIRQPDIYNAILSAIAAGASKSNEIATRTGEDAAKCLKYMQTLIEMEILEKRTPVLEKPSARKSVYRIRDPLFRFWYKYVANNRSMLEEGGSEIIWKKRIEPDYSSYMGSAFEEVCRQYLMRKNISGELPLLFSEIGSWWGSDPETHRAEEMDLAACDGNRFLFAECKWTNTPLGMDVLDTLQRRADLIRKKRDASWFFLFSRSGFTKELSALAKKNGEIRLIALNDLFR